MQIAQVHRATLIDGQELVVKVQHEGIKKVILEDLKNAKSIIDWVAWAEPQYDFNAMIDEWCKEAPKELDFRIEAENTRTVSRNLGCKNKDDSNHAHRVDVLIPEIIQTTETVLVLEYMDGIRLNDSETLEAYGVDKQRLLRKSHVHMPTKYMLMDFSMVTHILEIFLSARNLLIAQFYLTLALRRKYQAL